MTWWERLNEWWLKVVRKKTRAQQREIKRLSVNESLED